MVRTDKMSVKQAASVLAKASWQRNGKRKAMVLQKKKNETNANKRREQAGKELALRRKEIERKNQRVLPGRITKKKPKKAPKNQTKKPAPKKPPTIIDRGKGKSKATQRKLAMAGQRFTSARPATRSTAIFD